MDVAICASRAGRTPPLTLPLYIECLKKGGGAGASRKPSSWSARCSWSSMRCDMASYGRSESRRERGVPGMPHVREETLHITENPRWGLSLGGGSPLPEDIAHMKVAHPERRGTR